MYIVYELATGNIKQVTTIHNVVPTYAGEGMGILEVGPDANSLHRSFYVENGVLTPRKHMMLPQTLNMRLGESFVFDLPSNSSVYINGVEIDVSDDKLEIVGEMMADYVIEVFANGYLDCSVNIKVVE